MKNVLSTVLMSIAVLLIISSCATVPKEPVGAGELRLLSMDIPPSGSLSAYVEYWVTVNFVAAGNPEIRRACFEFSGYSPECVDVEQRYVTYGSRAYFRVLLHTPLGSGRLDYYAEYIRNGEVQRTNTVSTYIMGYEVR
jgi:hypothetical protein